MWSRQGLYALRSGPWVITRMMVDGADGAERARYCLTHDERVRWWCGVRLYVMRWFESAAAAKAAAEADDRGAGGDGLDR